MSNQDAPADQLPAAGVQGAPNPLQDDNMNGTLGGFIIRGSSNNGPKKRSTWDKRSK